MSDESNIGEYLKEKQQEYKSKYYPYYHYLKSAKYQSIIDNKFLSKKKK